VTSLYDEIGGGYAGTRRPDPRIARALGYRLVTARLDGSRRRRSPPQGYAAAAFCAPGS
jgi:hypothetical protein